MDKARADFYTDFIAENSYNQGKLFRAASSLLKKPTSIDASCFVNDLGSFFVKKISEIRSRLDAEEVSVQSRPASPLLPPDVIMREFKDLTKEDVKALIQHSSRKSCPLDLIPSKLFAKCDELLPVITLLINKSLRTGVFPRVWKEALVTPLLKKPGADINIFQNHRPVSNFSFVSKLAEKAVFNQIQNYLCVHNIYPDQQSAYRKNYSTEKPLLKVKNDLLVNMNKQHVTLLIQLDLSAAFDTIDHKVLIDCLNTRCGISDAALQCYCQWCRITIM